MQGCKFNPQLGNEDSTCCAAKINKSKKPNISVRQRQMAMSGKASGQRDIEEGIWSSV